MDIAISLVGAIVWPVTVIWLGYLFRAELGQLLGRLESIKYKDAEAKFNQQLREAEKAAPPMERRISELGGEKATARAVITRYEQFRRIAEISPRAAILEAWLDVESAVYTAAEQAKLEVKGPANVYSLARNLVSLGKIPENVMPFFEQLRRLRNNAVSALIEY